MQEHESEPVRGLPAAPPPGETILWQGAPQSWALAKRSLSVDWIAAYFLGLALWRGATVGSAEGAAAGLVTASWYVAIGAVAVAVLTAMAFAMARATVYTLTNRRVVMRIGAALSVTLNLPYTQIESADLRRERDGTGSLELTLKGASKLSYLVLWPHVRPWSIVRPRPTLRCLADPQAAAAILAEAARARVAEAPAEELRVGPRPAPAFAHPYAAE